MKKLILIPTALITGSTPVISLVGCNNNNEYQYLVDIDFTHDVLLDILELKIDLSDWKHDWDNTDIELSYNCDIASYIGTRVEPTSNQISVRYNVDKYHESNYDISEPELAITLTEKTNNIAKTYRFTFVVEIRDMKLSNYTFKTLE